MAPPSRHDFPSDLYAFAQTLEGTYEERYPRILDRAFLEHKLFLNANNVRMIAGGGSQDVAKAAVEAWQSKLHGFLAQRVDAGVELPAELSARFSAAMLDLWAVSRKHAAADFKDREAALLNEASQAESRAKDLRERLESEIELSKKIQGQLDDARAVERSMQQDLETLTLRAQKAEQALERLTREHQLQADAQAAAAEELRRQLRSTEQLLEKAQADLREQADRASTERESVRKQHMLDMDRVRTELRGTKDALEKANTTLTARAAELATALAEHLAELNEVRAQYARDLAGKESAAQVAGVQAAGEIARLNDALVASQRERDLLDSALKREAQANQEAAVVIEQLRSELSPARGKSVKGR